MDRCHGPILLSKTNLLDGFYQIPLTPTGALKLAVPFKSASEEPLVAIPTRLPMGWTQSPPAFSAATETIIDLVNVMLETNGTVPPSHHLKTKALTPVGLVNPTAYDAFPIKDSSLLRHPLACIDIYVD